MLSIAFFMRHAIESLWLPFSRATICTLRVVMQKMIHHTQGQEYFSHYFPAMFLQEGLKETVSIIFTNQNNILTCRILIETTLIAHQHQRKVSVYFTLSAIPSSAREKRNL
jgi:hypothetical protein